MSFEENIISIRVYSVLSSINEILNYWLKTDLYLTFDIQKFIDRKQLKLLIELTNKYTIFCFEEYKIEDYELQIVKYNYSYLDESEIPIFSCDNRPHHPELSTFPHYKHYYPKQSHKPVAFSGKLSDFLKEVKEKFLSRKREI
jgi:hypothetical protein